jgi:hypothetical protein
MCVPEQVFDAIGQASAGPGTYTHIHYSWAEDLEVAEARSPGPDDSLDLISDVHMSWNLLREEIDRRLRVALDEKAPPAARCRAAAWLATVSQAAASLDAGVGSPLTAGGAAGPAVDSH